MVSEALRCELENSTEWTFINKYGQTTTSEARRHMSLETLLF